ncbi:MAG: hypothetical protein AB7S55_01960 [Thiomonas sp.]
MVPLISAPPDIAAAIASSRNRANSLLEIFLIYINKLLEFLAACAADGRATKRPGHAHFVGFVGFVTTPAFDSIRQRPCWRRCDSCIAAARYKAVVEGPFFRPGRQVIGTILRVA